MAAAALVLVPTAVWASHNADDVPESDWAHADVEWMYAKELTNGCSASLYCPDGNLTRREMAAFTHREQLNLGTRTGFGAWGPINVPSASNILLGSVFIDAPLGGGSIQAVAAFNDLDAEALDHLGIIWLEASSAEGGECDDEGIISWYQPYGTYETDGWGGGTVSGYFPALAGTKRIDVCAWTTGTTEIYADVVVNWVAAGPDGDDVLIASSAMSSLSPADLKGMKDRLLAASLERANS